jgi:hypothetical protein
VPTGVAEGAAGEASEWTVLDAQGWRATAVTDSHNGYGAG